MLSPGRAGAALSLALMLVLGRASAAPAESDSAAAEARPQVEVVVAGSAEDAASFEAAVGELLGRLGVELAVRRVEQLGAAPVPPVGVVSVRVDLTLGDRAVVRARGRTGQETERRIVQSSSRAILLDEAAHVTQAAVESLLAEEAARPSPPPAVVEPKPAAETPPPPPAKAAPRPARARFGADVAALFGLHAVGPDAPVVPGAGVGVNAAYRGGSLRPGAWLVGEYRFPFDVGDSPVPPQAQTFSLRLVPSIDVARSARLALQLGAGGGADRFHVTHATEDPQGHEHASRANRWSPVLTGLLALRVGLVDNVQLTALALMDVDPSPPDLEVRPRSRQESRPWSVRPGLMLGVSFTPVGVEPVP